MPVPMNCPHGMPSRASCIDCMLDGPVEVQAQQSRLLDYKEYIDGFIPEAQYEGQCSGCNLPIHLGEPLYRMKKGERTWWIHTTCIE